MKTLITNERTRTRGNEQTTNKNYTNINDDIIIYYKLILKYFRARVRVRATDECVRTAYGN